MQRVRRCHIDRVDIGIVCQRGVAAMPARRTKSLAKRLGRLGRARAYGHQFGIVELGQPARELAGNIAGAENTPARLSHCYLLLLSRAYCTARIWHAHLATPAWRYFSSFCSSFFARRAKNELQM